MVSDSETVVEGLNHVDIVNVPITPPTSVQSIHYSAFPEFHDTQFQQILKMYFCLCLVFLISIWLFFILFFIYKLINYERML
jgi:hypothetical protein